MRSITTVLAALALLAACGAGSDAPTPSGVALCVHDTDCPAGQDCEHISGVSGGTCVGHQSPCPADETFYVEMPDLGFQGSCMRYCSSSCTTGFFCWATVCFPSSWKTSLCTYRPKASGCSGGA